MTQGKVSVSNKSAENINGLAEVPANNVAPTAPPSYEEATGTDGKKRCLQTSPTMATQAAWAHDTCSSPVYSSGGAYNGDTEMLTALSWDDQNVRRSFIRKVYSILLTQLLVTLAVVALFTFSEPVKDYVQANPGWYWASYVVFFVTYLTLACCSGPRRYFPWNLILLGIFTLSMAYVTGMLSSYYNTKSVILCLGITALVCLSVTLFSFQTKIDITSCQGVLFVLVMVLLFSGLFLVVLIPFQYIPWLHGIYAVLGAIVFTMDLSVAFYKHLQPCEPSDEPMDVHFLCCDIDADLIDKAQASNPFPKSISYVTSDIMDSSDPGGPIRNFLDGFNRSTFDLGFCMSITMWIHLNHGDQGLIDFLNRVTKFCDYLLIEPQPWKCYRQAARRLRKLGRPDFDHFHTLSIRGNMAKRITSMLTHGGNAKLIHRFGTTNWGRSLLLFQVNRPAK
uniref:Protein lifeguard 2 n=1 Tax=Leptobrachium leishanense TaxID=445787 RepID=A0A8C5P792_9ANUR